MICQNSFDHLNREKTITVDLPTTTEADADEEKWNKSEKILSLQDLFHNIYLT